MDFAKYKRDYLKLYKDTIEKIVHQEDSSRPFVLSSPSNGIIQTDYVGGVNSNPQGDYHLVDLIIRSLKVT